MVRRRALTVAAGTVLVLGGGAGYAAMRAVGDGCPKRESLALPEIDWTQEPEHYVTVTLTNPNRCYGFDREPVEITVFGPHGWRAISYYGDGAPHSDVGVCCTVSLPPRGTWTVRLGSEVIPSGANDIRICNIRVQATRSSGFSVWKRMPEGGAVTGAGSFPPGFSPKPTPLPDDARWRAPCDSPSASPQP